jgi:TATA-binding protein-associated factor Taf7
MNIDQDLIFEAYVNNNQEVEQDDNDQFTPEEAAADDQTNETQPLEDEENNELTSITKALQEIVAELKTLNQYADFITTGTRAQGFTGTGRT